MNTPSTSAATVTQARPDTLELSGDWTAFGLGDMAARLKTLSVPETSQRQSPLQIEGARIEALDTAGALMLQKLLLQLAGSGPALLIQGLRPGFVKLNAAAAAHALAQRQRRPSSPCPEPALMERLGRRTLAVLEQALGLVRFIGECSHALLTTLAQPARFRWRPVLFNIRSAGFDALPIVGLLSFLLGIVVAYQGADQLRQYGANIFVADLIGLSMLREFAPLITAIIIAGRSGSAYAAQIGTMAVTEEIDAMRTLGIAPLEMLVLPKILALLVALPLLTVFADVLGVFGGMLMAKAQLGVGYAEFIERFSKAVSVTAYLVGICKAPVFAVIIAVVGCFQGFRTHGGADSVGRQTTRSVVQAIFLVIVADALFSVAFSALDL
jgi:phospholipid/cholesterol/gamma-HCH transport system permease protein